MLVVHSYMDGIPLEKSFAFSVGFFPLGVHGLEGVLVPAVGAVQVVGDGIVIDGDAAVGKQLFHLGGKTPGAGGVGGRSADLVRTVTGVLLGILVGRCQGQVVR